MNRKQNNVINSSINALDKNMQVILTADKPQRPLTQMVLSSGRIMEAKRDLLVPRAEIASGLTIEDQTRWFVSCTHIIVPRDHLKMLSSAYLIIFWEVEYRAFEIFVYFIHQGASWFKQSWNWKIWLFDVHWEIEYRRHALVNFWCEIGSPEYKTTNLRAWFLKYTKWNFNSTIKRPLIGSLITIIFLEWSYKLWSKTCLLNIEKLENGIFLIPLKPL